MTKNLARIDPFRIRDFVADHAAIQQDYERASEQTRASLPSRLDQPYGTSPLQRLDLFFPPGRGTARPIHLFIHGGYWRAGRRQDYAFVADAITAHGAIAAIADYELMPATRIGSQVAQVRAAARWIAVHAAEFGGDAERLSVSGHSAGAHLAVYLAATSPSEAPAGASTPPLRGLLLLSGIYDLTPIMSSFLQEELALTNDDIRLWSPLVAKFDAGPKYKIVAGSAETIPFLDQARDFVAALTAHGARCRLEIVAANHMSIVRQLGIPESPVGRLLRQTINA